MKTLTLIHVGISLVAILSGFVVAAGLVTTQPSKRWTDLFLVTTIATSVTGFFFPFERFTPAFVFGVVSLLVLSVVLYAFYARRLVGAWRWVFALGAVFALYLNFFVLVVQSFLKVPALKSLAPTQAEPPFVITQAITLLGFVVLGILAARRFHPVAPSSPLEVRVS